MYNKAIQYHGSIRKAAEVLGLTKSKLMVLAKKELNLCTATTACQNKPKNGRTRCEQHLKYSSKTQDKTRKSKTDKVWRTENRSLRQAYQKEYQRNNRDKVNAYNRKYSKSAKGQVVNRAKRAYRRALQKQATPPWVNRKALKEFYKNCPKGHHVDHIIPLEYDDVCGLHVPWNLQYLTAFENDSKGNKWDGTIENELWRVAK